MSKKVLIVDDSAYMRALIEEMLKSNGFQIIGTAENGEKAIDLALELKPDYITLDNILPDMVGLDIIKILKQDEKINSKILMISAVGQDSVINEALELGAEGYLVKPFNSDKLLLSINQL